MKVRMAVGRCCCDMTPPTVVTVLLGAVNFRDYFGAALDPWQMDTATSTSVVSMRLSTATDLGAETNKYNDDGVAFWVPSVPAATVSNFRISFLGAKGNDNFPTLDESLQNYELRVALRTDITTTGTDIPPADFTSAVDFDQSGVNWTGSPPNIQTPDISSIVNQATALAGWSPTKYLVVVMRVTDPSESHAFFGGFFPPSRRVSHSVSASWVVP